MRLPVPLYDKGGREKKFFALDTHGGTPQADNEQSFLWGGLTPNNPVASGKSCWRLYQLVDKQSSILVGRRKTALTNPSSIF